MRSPLIRPRRSSGELSRSTMPSGPLTSRQPSGGASTAVSASAPSASAALSSAGPPRKNTPGGLTTSRHWTSTSSPGVSEGWLRMTPRLPSSLQFRISRTHRAKLGSANVAEAISSEPAAGCMHSMVASRPGSAHASVRASQQCRRDGGPSPAAPGDAQTVGGGRADGDVDAVPFGDAALSLLATWPEPRPVPDQLAGDVADLPAGVAHPTQGLGEQVVAGSVGPLRLRRTEVAAEIAEPRG